MSDELQKLVEQIIIDCIRQDYGVADAAKKIAQAFKDADYRHIPPTGDEKAKAIMEIGEELIRSAGFLTGEQWYDRFKRELGSPFIEADRSTYATVDVMNSARKAAGLE